MRDDDIDPEDEDEDADVEEGRRSALEEEEEEEDVEEDDDDNVIGRMSSSSSSSIAGLHNVSNTCYLNATVQVYISHSVCDIFFFLSSSGPIQPISRDVFGQQQQQRG